MCTAGRRTGPDFTMDAMRTQKGEFCEVHNASITDPGAWLGKVIKYDSEKDTYTVNLATAACKQEGSAWCWTVTCFMHAR